MTPSPKSKQGKRVILGLALLIILATYLVRVFPYLTDSMVPLGYDPGIYKMMFEAYRENLPNIDLGGMDRWIKSNPMGLFLLTNMLYLFSYSTSFLLTHFLALLSVAVAIFIYLVAAHRFPKHKLLVALVTFALYFISIAQYQVFWWAYYKNVLGLILILASVRLLQRKHWLAVLPLGFLMVTHRPAALFTGGVLATYVLVNFLAIFWKSLKKKEGVKEVMAFIKSSLEIKAGIIALGVVLVFYYNNFQEAILPAVHRVVTSFDLGLGSGTFFTVSEYLWYSIWYWPLAIYGLVTSIKTKTFGYIESGFLFGVVWVFLHLFFYNRMIIQLDVFLILMAIIGVMNFLVRIKKEYLRFVIPLSILFAIFAGGNTLLYAKKEAHSLIGEKEFNFIQSIPDLTEENAIIIATYRTYSPWIGGYSGRDIIAPGLFDMNRHGKKDWIKLWWDGDGKDKERMLRKYTDLGRPLYIYEGIRQPHDSFENSNCFETLYEDRYKFRKFICHASN